MKLVKDFAQHIIIDQTSKERQSPYEKKKKKTCPSI